MTALRAIKQSLNHTIGLVQDELARGGKNAHGLQVLHDSLVFIRDNDLSRVPLDPQAREEALDRHPIVAAHSYHQGEAA